MPSVCCFVPMRRCLCSVAFWILSLQTLGLIAVYFLFSITLTFYQKWFIKDFKFPLSVVICHLVIKFTLAAILRQVLECCSQTKRVVLNWPTYVKRLSAVGVTSALDIGLSNWSFEFITVSLYTMSKSSCVIFILIFSILFGLEKLRVSLVLVVLLISTGLFMFTFHSTQFSGEGFAMVMAASLTGGLRWTLAQLVMQKQDLGLTHPVDMIYHIQPWMILGLLPLAVYIEGIPLVTNSKVFRFEDLSIPLKTSGLVMAGSVLAFFMEMSEFLLLFFTSSLTLSLAGVVKETCIMFLAWLVNGDTINSTINFIGLILSLLGICLHVFLKAIHSNGDSETESSIEMPLLSGEFLLDDDDEDTVFEVQKRR